MSRLTPERVRAMVAAATPGPWTWRSDDIDGCHVVEDPRARYEEEERLAETFRDSTADIVLMSAAPDLAADLLDAHAALATERERREAAEAAVATLRKAIGDAANTAARAAFGQRVRAQGALQHAAAVSLAKAGAYDHAETLMRDALAGCP